MKHSINSITGGSIKELMPDEIKKFKYIGNISEIKPEKGKNIIYS